MSKFVLDASALLVFVNEEPGVENLPTESEIMRFAAVSSVNLAEAHSKLVMKGIPAHEAWEAVMAPIGEIADFNPHHAKRAGELILQTRHFGLSLGDRACLALAIELGVPVYTTDRIWAKLDVGVPIHVIR